MNKSIFTIFTAALFVLFSNFATAKACSCSGIAPCEAFARANTVFVGTVISTKTITKQVQFEKDEKAFPMQYQVSRFRIDERFSDADFKEAEVITDISTSCAWELKKGAKYLIYGYGSGESFTTGYCSRSTELKSAQEDLKYLRAVAKASKGAVVSGSLFYNPLKDWNQSSSTSAKGTLNNIINLGITSLRLRNESNSFEAQIKSDGTYQFTNIPKGKYQLFPVLPAERTIYGDKEFREVEISGQGCGYENFTILDSGKVTGNITNKDGKAVKNLSVSLIPTDMGTDFPFYLYDRVASLTVRTDDNGTYTIKGLPKGSYYVAIRGSSYINADSVDAAYPTAFYPGVTELTQRKFVQATPGKVTTGIDFILPNKFSETTVKGQVLFKDGRPAPKVFVRYVARTPDRRKNSIVFIKTDENGYFSFTGYENHRYLIGAFTDQRQGNIPAFAVEQEISIKDGVKELKFVLDHNDDEKCQECRDYIDYPTGNY